MGWKPMLHRFAPLNHFHFSRSHLFTVHGSRFTVHGSRFTVHGSRFKSGSRGRRGFRPERVEAERRRGGRLPLAKALRCKLRHFTDAAVLGSEAYVESVFAAFPERFGPKRKSGARKLRGVEAKGLRCLRDLQAKRV